MASLKYLQGEVRKNMPEANIRGKKPTKDTLTQYAKQVDRYVSWAKTTYKCRSFDALGKHIQDYSDYLQAEGKSAATIHGYLAACCYVWQIPLATIKKPKRCTCDTTRSRGTKLSHTRSDTKRACSPRLYDFAINVGIRRKEYMDLKQNNLKRDESGYLCVEVLRGKGGKYQLQRLLPGTEDAVSALFDGSTNFVFTKAEMENKLDLHHLRALQAQKAYRYYTNRMEKEPAYRQQLALEIEARWRKYRGTKKRAWEWSPKLLKGQYSIRGRNRDFAIAKGIPIHYDRLTVMAVSIFHLSHWRCDVTVGHYLLAV